MRGVLIGEAQGFKITYYAGGEKFLLFDKDGEEVGEGATQAEAVEQIKKILKDRSKGRFPIRAFLPEHRKLQEVNITSYNRGDQSARYTIPGKKRDEYGGSHQKLHLWSRSVAAYEWTEKNADIVLTVSAKWDQIKALEKEIDNLKTLLEKPIDREYFED